MFSTSINIYRMVAALFLLNASARRVAVAWAPRATTSTTMRRSLLASSSVTRTSGAATGTAQRWMSTNGDNEVVEKTEEEKAAIKADREARK
jgi:hypothetical protein